MPQRTFFIETMIKDMRLIQMARKWRKATVTKQRRITLGTGSVADKGHCIVYTTDNRRFMVPLKYLHCDIFRELFRMSEEAFGLPGNGPITFPCDSVFMDFVVSILKRRLCKDLEKALLMYLASTTAASRGCLSSFSSFEIGMHPSEGKNIVRQTSLLHGF